MGLSSNAVAAADIVVSEKRAKLQAVRNARRSSNKIRRLHHTPWELTTWKRPGASTRTFSECRWFRQ